MEQEIAIGYIRVSTGKQAKYGVSFPMQFDKIRAYCAYKGYYLAGIYGDAISAKNIKDRPGVQAVLHMATQHRAHHVITYKMNRMFRNVEETLAETKKFDQCGVGFHSVTEEINTKSPMGRFFFLITAGYDQMEREVIAERTSDALQSKKARGERIGRWAPIGCEIIGTEPEMRTVLDRKGVETEREVQAGGFFVQNEQEIEAIHRARIYQEEGYSLRKIAARLYEEGFTSRTGGIFPPTTIRKMLVVAA